MVDLLCGSLDNHLVKVLYQLQELHEIVTILNESKATALKANYRNALIPLEKVDKIIANINSFALRSQESISQINNCHNMVVAFNRTLLKRENHYCDTIKNILKNDLH